MHQNSNRHQRAVRRGGMLGLFILLVSGCINFPTGLFPESNSFIGVGTYQEHSAFLANTCPAWIDDYNVVYYLFQGPDVSSEDFDKITTLGVRSRLQLRPRTNLQTSCPQGTVVEVEKVIDILN